MYRSQRGQLKINNCNQKIGDCFNLSFELAKHIWRFNHWNSSFKYSLVTDITEHFICLFFFYPFLNKFSSSNVFAKHSIFDLQLVKGKTLLRKIQ